MPIKHKFHSGLADGNDTTLVRPSDWNDDHEGINDHAHTGANDGGIISYTSLSDKPTLIKGDKGEKGDKGADGYTPVKGVDYFDGAKGDQGEQGLQGEKGDAGPQGLQGIQGVQGNPGSDASVTKANVEAVLTGVITSHSHTSTALTQQQIMARGLGA